MKKIRVLFGGSFNPPTIAHKEIISYLASLDYISEVIVLPNGDSYHYNNKNLANFEMRCKMLELIINDKKVVLNKEEGKLPFEGIVKTLKRLDHPYYVLGSDCLKDLKNWKNPDELLKENMFLVLKRGNENNNEIINNDEFLLKYRDHFIFEDYEFSNVSSSLYKETKNDRIIPEEVKDFIIKNHLYEN